MTNLRPVEREACRKDPALFSLPSPLLSDGVSPPLRAQKRRANFGPTSDCFGAFLDI